MPSSTVSELHQKLAALHPRALFLLGGSVERGEAAATSDIDLYCIAPLHIFLKIRKNVKNILLASNMSANCMWVLPYMLSRGWYYVDGVDTCGMRHTTSLNKVVILQNCLFLAIIKYLLGRVEHDQEIKSMLLKKSKQQLAALKFLLAHDCKKISFAQKDLDLFNTAHSESDLNKELRLMSAQVEKMISFTWSGFFLYNMQFLRCGMFLNLRSTPAILVLQLLKKTLETDSVSKHTIVELNKIVFPSYIL